MRAVGGLTVHEVWGTQTILEGLPQKRVATITCTIQMMN